MFILEQQTENTGIDLLKKKKVRKTVFFKVFGNLTRQRIYQQNFTNASDNEGQVSGTHRNLAPPRGGALGYRQCHY